MNWSARELARRVGCAASTISAAERGVGIPNVQTRTLRRIKDALEAAGVEFITGGNGPGVRLRRQP